MLQKLREQEFGPIIDFREYSFLENPRLPKQVKESKLRIELCNEGSNDCLININREPGVLKLPRNSSEDQIKAALSAHKAAKLIEYSSMENAFGGFTDKTKEWKFRNRVKRYMGIWCCLERLQIGHIYYDMYWDEKPNWKPVAPATREEDHPPW